MALQPTLSYVSSNLSRILTVTDTTVYGSPELNRNQVSVVLRAYKVKAGVTTEYTLTYNPLTVTAWTIDINGDGWYRLVLEITEIDNPENVVTRQYDFILMDKLCSCFVKTSYKMFKDSTCGCENISGLYCLEGQIRGLEVLVQQGDLDSADKTLDRLNQECELLSKKGCGC